MKFEETEMIVLKHTDYGDHDRIFNLYTKKFGKISAFASSVKRSQKRFGSSLDLFSYGHAHLHHPKSAGKKLWRLMKVEILDPFVSLRQNLYALAYGGYFSECVWNLLADEDPHPEIFDFLTESFRNLSSSESHHVRLLQMEIELLKLCGYEPRFFECVECNRSISEAKVFFSFMKGGVVCGTCYNSEQGLWMPSSVDDTKNFLVVRDILDRFVTHIVGKELKSQTFRREIYGSI